VEVKQATMIPTSIVKSTRVNPKRLLVYSKPKAGKTTAFAGLKDNLIIDLEDGADYVDALKVKVTNLTELRQVGDEIKKAGYPYKVVTIDTVTILEDLVKPLALKNYMSTPIGKNFKEDDVLKLPQGAGYYWLREAFFQVLNYIDTFAPNIILAGHLKDKQVDDRGEMVMAANIDLTGKIKSLICANADAIGYMFRRGNQTILSFIASDEITCGARPEHLKNQEIILAEEVEGNYITHWDRIYK